MKSCSHCCNYDPAFDQYKTNPFFDQYKNAKRHMSIYTPKFWALLVPMPDQELEKVRLEWQEIEGSCRQLSVTLGRSSTYPDGEICSECDHIRIAARRVVKAIGVLSTPGTLGYEAWNEVMESLNPIFLWESVIELNQLIEKRAGPHLPELDIDHMKESLQKMKDIAMSNLPQHTQAGGL
jgi:hypothetical protein